MKYLFLIRGLPGSGKTTKAGTLGVYCVAADDFMVDAEGNYDFRPDRLRNCHDSCRVVAEYLLKCGKSVAVHNTFTQQWEVEPYLALAKRQGATVRVIDLFDAGLTDEQLAERNTHGVPAETIEKMRARWEKISVD